VFEDVLLDLVPQREKKTEKMYYTRNQKFRFSINIFKKKKNPKQKSKHSTN